MNATATEFAEAGLRVDRTRRVESAVHAGSNDREGLSLLEMLGVRRLLALAALTAGTLAVAWSFAGNEAEEKTAGAAQRLSERSMESSTGVVVFLGVLLLAAAVAALLARRSHRV